ncbi:hypothetical protein ACJX0J_005985, partial [Zea mays]
RKKYWFEINLHELDMFACFGHTLLGFIYATLPLFIYAILPSCFITFCFIVLYILN